MEEGKKIPKIQLVSIYAIDQDDIHSALYQLLLERQPDESISHNFMPTIKQHTDYINRRPHKEWYAIADSEATIVGSIYLSHTNEIGIAIFKRHRRQGYATAALTALISTQRNGTRLLANINPNNDKSILLFDGFKFRHIQQTYELIVTHPEAGEK